MCRSVVLLCCNALVLLSNCVVGLPCCRCVVVDVLRCCFAVLVFDWFDCLECFDGFDCFECLIGLINVVALLVLIVWLFGLWCCIVAALLCCVVA